MNEIKEQIAKILSKALGFEVKAADFAEPPKPEMGDFAYPCFELAKEQKKAPAVVTTELVNALDGNKDLGQIVSKMIAVGPYLNLFIDNKVIISSLQKEALKGADVGRAASRDEKLMVEFAHPNTHKAFHIGHLRNAVTGESIVRIMENAGYTVARANYQGDVGMHIAKALWGIMHLRDEFEKVKSTNLNARVEFLGRAYAHGAQNFEQSKDVEMEIGAINEKIYEKAEDIKEIYELTRAWSLEYFENVYKRLDVHFDRYYFESEVFKRGKELVLEGLKAGIFAQGEGAIIFEGEKYGLHTRVFINSKGFTTYEAKDVGLAELQFKEYQPSRIIHVVGKEQTEYFKVIFKAIEFVFPEEKGKEYHLPYGWVSLKHGKMSSRTGKVVLGEWLLGEIEKRIGEIMKTSEIIEKDLLIKRISLAAVKYAMLKVNVDGDMAFDIDESINLTGDSGPYLLYIGARINSIIEKVANLETSIKAGVVSGELVASEKKLIKTLLNYSDVCVDAATNLDPSRIAKYLFNLAQNFNNFYNECPILKAEQTQRNFRLGIIRQVLQVMTNGLYLLGITKVEKM